MVVKKGHQCNILDGCFIIIAWKKKSFAKNMLDGMGLPNILSWQINTFEWPTIVTNIKLIIVHCLTMIGLGVVQIVNKPNIM